LFSNQFVLNLTPKAQLFQKVGLFNCGWSFCVIIMSSLWDCGLV